MVAQANVVAPADVVAQGDGVAHLIFYYRKMRYKIEWPMNGLYEKDKKQLLDKNAIICGVAIQSTAE